MNLKLSIIIAVIALAGTAIYLTALEEPEVQEPIDIIPEQKTYTVEKTIIPYEPNYDEILDGIEKQELEALDGKS